MNEDLRGRAIAAVKALGKRGRTSRVPMSVRNLVLSWVEAARGAGRPWREISRELGLSATGLQRWQRCAAGHVTARTSGSMLPVVVREPRVHSAGHERVTLVTPSGLRVEGLAVAQAADLIVRLS